MRSTWRIETKLACQQPHFGTTNGRINLDTKLEKYKLDQMAERNTWISLDKRIHLIPKWRRPRMVWVEVHENEASRATEHKRFYKATTGKWTDILRIQEKSTKTANVTLCLHDFEKPRLFFRMNTFTRSRLTKIKVIFYYCAKVLPQFQSPRGTT